MKSIMGLSSHILLGLVYSCLQCVSPCLGTYGGGGANQQGVYTSRRGVVGSSNPNSYSAQSSSQQKNPPDHYGSYRHYNIHCWKCWSDNPSDDCAKGNIDNHKAFEAEKCEDADVNLCYVFKNSKTRPNGEVSQEIYRGCAKNSGNPCNTGIKYDSCSYQVCQHDLCNSSSDLSSPLTNVAKISAIMALGFLLTQLILVQE